MRVVRLGLAASLCLGVALAASFADAGILGDRLNGFFIVVDDVDPGNSGGIQCDFTQFHVEGEVDGIGTDTDVVQINFFAQQPTNVSANSFKARVQQKRFSILELSIASGVDARDLNTGFAPEKCQIIGSVNMNQERGNVTVKCSGEDIFAGITVDQLTSIQDAFADNNRVKVKFNAGNPAKGSIAITIKGAAFED